MGEPTPGPWMATPADMFGDHNIVVRDSDDARAIAAVVSNLRPADEVQANAHLIAAAPDLLEALRRTIKWLAIAGDERADRDADLALAAIAKAEGRTNG